MNSLLRLAVVGTGTMAKMRTQAFLTTKKIKLVGVASRELEHARRFSNDRDCIFYTDNYLKLADCHPDILLVEVPHAVQDSIVQWALERRYHVLVGSCMARDMEGIATILELAKQHKLIVEAGYEARYKQVWIQVKALIEGGTIGDVCAIQAIACWGANTESWYYSQAESGGMPLTHMSYAFLNPLTWLFGMPHAVSAFANAKGVKKPGMVDQVSCCVNLQYRDQIACQLLASYIHYQAASDWRLYFHGTKAGLEVFPGEFDGGRIHYYANGKDPQQVDVATTNDPFVQQAEEMILAIHGQAHQLQNSPEQSAMDVKLVSAILQSIRTSSTVKLAD